MVWARSESGLARRQQASVDIVRVAFIVPKLCDPSMSFECSALLVPIQARISCFAASTILGVSGRNHDIMPAAPPVALTSVAISSNTLSGAEVWAAT